MSIKAKQPISEEFLAIDTALKRAAKVAHATARKTKTPCYIWQDGRIIDLTTAKTERQPTASGKHH
jgi:hypothetical protein